MLEKRLLELWKKYQGQMSSDKLNEILVRGICYSEVKHRCPILVTGINPSYRRGDTACNNDISTFSYQEIIRSGDDHYFHAINKLFPEDWQTKVEYLDILNVRESDLNVTWDFCKDGKGLELVAQNLRLSQLMIEQVIQPRLIVVKNKSSWDLWGKSATPSENVWMGYKFELEKSLDCGDLCRIVGLVDHTDRVSYDFLLETNLKGTSVLFTYHSRAGKDPSQELMRELCARL